MNVEDRLKKLEIKVSKLDERIEMVSLDKSELIDRIEELE